MGDRTILHCDLNGFYASVECLLNPSLREVPMAVCGDPQLRHGIILAKNELAKAYGVVTAETIWQARRKCPQLVLVPPTRSEYQKYSRLVNQIYLRYTDLVEPFSIDESWLDVTGTLHLFHTDGKGLADEIRRVVREELGLTLSVGVSYNKVYAKLGSDYKKPDATTVISRENRRQILDPLPVTDLLFVGGSSAKTLASLGIRTIGQLAAFDPRVLAARMGRMGETIHDYAAGLDDSPVLPFDHQREVKSVGNGITFRRNLTQMGDVRTGVTALADQVARRLRQHGMDARTIAVQIRDPDFKTISRQKPLPRPTHLASELAQGALELIQASWNLRTPIRMITLTAASLVEEGSGEQLSFFQPKEDPGRQRRDRLERALDQVRGKYGRDAVSIGSSIHNDIGLDDPSSDSEGEEEASGPVAWKGPK